GAIETLGSDRGGGGGKRSPVLGKFALAPGAQHRVLQFRHRMQKGRISLPAASIGIAIIVAVGGWHARRIDRWERCLVESVRIAQPVEDGGAIGWQAAGTAEDSEIQVTH